LIGLNFYATQDMFAQVLFNVEYVNWVICMLTHKSKIQILKVKMHIFALNEIIPVSNDPEMYAYNVGSTSDVVTMIHNLTLTTT